METRPVTEEPKKKTQRTYKTTDSIPYLKEMIALLGVNRTSHKLGVSSTLISEISNGGKCRVAYELAAMGWILKNVKTEVEKEKSRTYVVKLTPDQQKFILPMMDHSKIFYMDITE